MKKLLTVALGLAVTIGLSTMTFAQEKKEGDSKEGKKKGKKKKKSDEAPKSF